MSSDERDLLLKVNADGSQAKTELGEVGASVAGVAEAEATAERLSERIGQAHVLRLREISEAAAAAGVAVADMGEAGSRGGKAYETAVLRARDAVARLEIAVASVRGLGGPVSPETIAELALYDNAVKASTLSIEESKAATKAMGIEQGFARGSMGGLANAMRNLGGAVGGTVLGFLAFEGIFKVLPAVFKGVEAAGTALGNMWAGLTGGIVETDKATEQLNAQLAKADDAHKKVADAADLLLRAQWAVNAGLIQGTDNLKLLAIEELAREGRLRGQINTTKEFADAVKGMGINVARSFEDMAAEQHTFIDIYETIMKERGPAAAERFAVMNKKFMQAAIESAHEAGERMIPEFEKLATHLGIVSKAYEEQTKALDKINAKLKEHEASLRQNAEQLAEHAREINRHTEVQTKAADMEFKAVSKSLDEQVVALNKARREGTITEREYSLEYGRLQAEQSEARRKWEQTVAEINAAAAEKMKHFMIEQNLHAEKTLANIEAEKNARGDLQLKIEKAHQEDMARMHAADAALDAKIASLRAHNEAVARANQLYSELVQTNMPKWVENVAKGIGELGRIAGGAAGMVKDLGIGLREISIGTPQASPAPPEPTAGGE